MFVLAFASALIGLSGCKGKNSNAGLAASTSGRPLKILHYGNGDEPQDLDSQITTGVYEYHLALALQEGLLSADPVTLEPSPGVAEKWEISADGLVYTFHLRANAKWSNGDPLTAKDFVRSYQRMLTASLAAEYAYMLFGVTGAQDYYDGKLKNFSQTGFKALDEHTFQLALRQPQPYLLSAMNHHAWFPVHIPTIEKFGGLARKGTAWTRPENFVGNGPFVLKEWSHNQKIIVARSPTYWDRDNVKLDEIHFYPINSIDTEERMFRTGQLHVTNEVPLTKIAVYRKEQPDSIHVDPYCGIYYYRLNVKRAPFTDVRVRKALALAVDRESLVKNVTLAEEIPAYSFVPPNVAGYTSRNTFKADLAEAKRLLAEAGYPDGKGFPPTEFLYNTLEKHRVIAEAIQGMWSKNLGITISLHNEEWKTYLDAQHSQNYQMQRAGWIADYVDPHVFFDVWETGGGNNDTNWGSPEYDRLLHSALDAKTTADRYEIYQKMEKILVDEMPVIPLFIYTRARLISPKVLGFHSTYLDNYPWKYVDLKN